VLRVLTRGIPILPCIWQTSQGFALLEDNRLFLPVLLHDEDVCIVAAYKEKQIVAGALANGTGEVVGLSNVFTPEQEAERYWGLLDVIAACYPALPVVVYEQGEQLALVLRVGFTSLGPLRVWIKEG
jgi:hypothetical protein